MVAAATPSCGRPQDTTPSCDAGQNSGLNPPTASSPVPVAKPIGSGTIRIAADDETTALIDDAGFRQRRRRRHYRLSHRPRQLGGVPGQMGHASPTS